MIKLANILREWKGDEQPTQVAAIIPAAYQGQFNWTNLLQRNKALSITKHTYESDNMLGAAKAIATESDEISIAIVQLIASKEALRDKITGVDALKSVCDRKDIQLILIGPEPESFTTEPKADFQQFMQWLSSSGLPVVDISDLTNPSYYDKNTNDLDKLGSRIIVKRIMKYISEKDPSIAAEVEAEENQEEEETAENPEKQAAGYVKPAGDIAKNPVTVSPAGMVFIPPKNRRRTGEATSWEVVMDFLMDKGLSQAGAAGIAGNMRIESNFKPDVYGDRGTSVGLCQWHATRMTALFRFAEDMGAEPLAVDTQLEYLWHELTKSYSGLVQKLKTATDPSTAAYYFASVFERPAHISQSRMRYAREYYENYTSTEPTANNLASAASGVGSFAQSAISAATSLVTLAGFGKNNKDKSAPRVDGKNGRLNVSQLTKVQDGHYLQPDAAKAFLRMKAAYENEHPGKTIKLSGSYRTFEVQNAIFDWDLYKRTGKTKKIGTNGTVAAAYPGTSNHGLGIAIDVGTKEARPWIQQHGMKYGWSWEEGRRVGESWHFTYVN